MTTPFPLSTNRALLAWVGNWARICRPEQVVWCDGSGSEYEQLCEVLVRAGTFVPLCPDRRQRSFWAKSDRRDVARVEDRTFICSELEGDAGPTNNWADPAEMKTTLRRLFRGSMKGRTMYVVPYIMGPASSPYSKIGVEITDSA